MKAMTTLQKIGRGFREIHRLEPQLIPLTMASGITKSALPFVNLYFSSRIIDILSTTRERNALILFVSLALAINLFLFITSRTLENRYYMSRGLLYNKERGEVIRKLYTLDYEKLESPAFQTLLHKHQEAMDKAGSSLYRLSWMLSNWVAGATTLVFALVLLFPLLKISFQGGKTFVESPWFAVALFAAIGVAVGIILIISRKISKEWFRLSEQYMGIDRLYDYYTEMISDYKTGKEIRTYQEQMIIEKDATQLLLNDGIAIQKKIAANSAKSSSLIAIIGAVIGFGIYLFSGSRGSSACSASAASCAIRAASCRWCRALPPLLTPPGKSRRLSPHSIIILTFSTPNPASRPAPSCRRKAHRFPLSSAMLASNTRDRKPMR